MHGLMINANIVESKIPEIAFNKGYVIKNGEVWFNNRKIKIRTQNPYPHFNFRYKGKILSVKCHQLAAWQKFGKSCQGDEIVIRHLDDNPLNFKLENIELGTKEDNQHDKYVNAMIREWIDLVNAEARKNMEVPF